MLVSEAQQDLRRAYVGGGPGVMISGLVWLVATWTLHNQGVGSCFAALLVGGMEVFTLRKQACRLLFRRA
ncbi:MAG: hypothetical protein Q7J32_10090, partial [Sphingomonadaceae bacterium]|nr:hypothetical protein [Sphingomonadaceae bacterium]